MKNEKKNTKETIEKKAEKNITEIVFILDKSGSMSGLEEDTIGGFNSMIERQKKDNTDGDTFVSTVLFDDKSTVLHDRVKLEEVSRMTDDDYQVGACTALLDAVGDAIKHIEIIHKYARPEDRPGKTMFVITTDGLENASRKYNFGEIKKLVERKQEGDGWEFLFIGANMDAIGEAGKFGIKAERAVNYCHDDMGTRAVFASVGNAVKLARNAKNSSELECCMVTPTWCEEINEDYNKREKKKGGRRKNTMFEK